MKKLNDRAMLLAGVLALVAPICAVSQTPSSRAEDFDSWFEEFTRAAQTFPLIAAIGKAWAEGCAGYIDWTSPVGSISLGNSPYLRAMSLEEYRLVADSLGDRCTRALAGVRNGQDSWEQDLELWVDEPFSEKHLLIRSRGGDGVFEGSEYTPSRVLDLRAGDDVVWADGFWIGKRPPPR